MYRLRHRLGRWGLGELYEAVDTASGVVRMLKIVRGRRAADRHIRAHMEWEFEAARRCSSPFLVKIHSLEDDPQLGLYHVMDLMPGETLAASLKRGVTFVAEKALQLVARVAGALEALEAGGMGHFEFGPDAVYLWDRGADLHPLVINVGLPPSGDTPPPLPLDVLAYAAPERKTGTRWDTRADVYSLCALLVHLLVGRPPPPQGWVTVPRLAAPTPLASELFDIAQRGLAADPEQRYPSMQALASALRFLAESSHVELGPLPADASEPPSRAAPGAPASPPPPPGPRAPAASAGPRPARSRPPKAAPKKTVLGMPTYQPPVSSTPPAAAQTRPPVSRRTPPLPVAARGPQPASSGMAGTPPTEKAGSGAAASGTAPFLPTAPPPPGAPGPAPEADRAFAMEDSEGAQPLEAEAFFGVDVDSVGAYDPSGVSSLPVEASMPATSPRKKWYVVAGAAAAALVLAAVVLLVWRPWSARRAGVGEGGGGKAAPRAGAVADAGLAAARRAPAHPVDAGVPARDAALAKGPTDAGRPRVAPDAGELQARARPTPRAGQPETAPRPRPKSKFDEYIEEGRKAMRRHKYALARRYFTKALHLRRTSVRVMRLMAEAHYRAHEYPAARYWFEKALQRAPKSASLNARLGKVYARLGKRSKACRYFLRAFHLRPNSRTYRLNVENYRCH